MMTFRRTTLSIALLVFLPLCWEHHIAHAFQLKMSSSTLTTKKATPKKLLIVGGGIGGLSSAFDANHILRSGIDEIDITVVSDRDSFQFTPSNPWVATRMRTPADISLPLNEILPKHNIHFVQAKATRLDPKAQRLELDNGNALGYDYLIIATGPRLALEEIPGALDTIKKSKSKSKFKAFFPWSKSKGQKNHLVSVCTTPHASHAAEQVDQLVTHPGPIVIGATQGASCFGPAYEFALLLQDELRKRGGKPLLEQCPMTLITSEPYIGHLGLKGAGNSRQLLEKLLTKKNIQFYSNCKIDKVASDHVTITQLQQKEDRTTKTTTMHLPSKFTMLIPPFRGHDVWKHVQDLTDKNGMISVNQFQQSMAYPNIFGVGVCVSIPPVETTPVPTGAPKTGYMIESQGTAAVKNIRDLMDHDGEQEKAQAKELKLRHRPLLNGLCITDFGSDGAIFLTLPQYPPRRTDITISGKVATLAKIAFEKYFLHKIQTGDTDPYYEKYMLHLIGVDRVTTTTSPSPSPSQPSKNET